MRMLAGHGTVSIDKARRVLGYKPRVDLGEGMRRCEALLCSIVHWGLSLIRDPRRK
jgi:nucleoside-diphosphate-sugar epimerase